jgi:putative ABC transport system substrate-binding protein
MDRRRFLVTSLGGALAASLTADAQSVGKTPHVGFLRVGTPPPSYVEPFRQGLRELGNVEGHSIRIEYGLGREVEQLPDIANALVRMKLDVLVASGTPSVLPARDATSTIPVVFVAAIDPVAIGLVTSLARPGGNVTGLTALHTDLTGKRLELLKEVLPSLSRVAFLVHAANPGHAQYVREAELAARNLGVQLQVLPVRGPDDFEEAFRRARGANGLVQVDDAMLTANLAKLIELAARYRIPAVYGDATTDVRAGGLMSLGPNYSDLYRRAATYVHKILKGAKPGNLPIEQPTRFDLVINLKTAKALGLTIPPRCWRGRIRSLNRRTANVASDHDSSYGSHSHGSELCPGGHEGGCFRCH